MLNWPILLSQKVRADSCNITEIAGIKRNEVGNKQRLKRPVEKEQEPCCGDAEEWIEMSGEKRKS